MEFSKLDAGLASAISAPPAENEVYLVSVRPARALSPAEQSEFLALGGMGTDSHSAVLSARLSRAAVERLAEQPWVRRLTLSRLLRPV